MLTIHTKTLFLVLCCVESVWLLLAQTLGSVVLLLPCLVCFLALAAWAALQNVALPVLLFFLPFSPLLKLMPGTMSIYTIALLMVYAIYAARGSRHVRITHLVPAIAIIALTITVKILSGLSVNNVYVFFAISLLLVPFLSVEMVEKYDTYWLVVFFSIGVIVSAITASFLATFPAIARYINVVNEMGIYRQSGYFSDPNYYAAHINAALAGVLVLLLNKVDKIKRAILVCMAVLLFYCGLLSLSKSLILVSVCSLLCWFLAFMFQKGRISSKLVMIITLLVLVMFILSSTIFSDLLDLMMFRFSNINNMSDFTTNRVDVWANYLRAFGEDPLLLFFGSGYSEMVKVDGRAAHNTIIQTVHQLGLVGIGLLVTWFVCLTKSMMTDHRRGRLPLAQLAILSLGIFGPWMALGYLFLDELFLFPMYMCAAVRCLPAVSDPLDA